MIDTIELQPIKIKFARLISRLYTDAKYPIENINESLIRSDILDCFESNQPEVFMRTPVEEISEKIGAGKMKFSENLNEELYWSGLQYMNIFFNKSIPLKQLLLLMPLSVMVEKFRIYHEMNDIEMLKSSDELLKTSILRNLRKQAGCSIRELSYITDIPENSLKRYEKDNEYLFSASFRNIHALSRYFNVDSSLFCKTSAFIPYSEHLWKDTNFSSELKRQICFAYKLNEDETLVVRDADDLKEASNNAHRIVVIEPISFLYTSYSSRILKKHLDDNTIKRAIYKSIRYAISNNDGINILL